MQTPAEQNRQPCLVQGDRRWLGAVIVQTISLIALIIAWFMFLDRPVKENYLWLCYLFGLFVVVSVALLLLLALSVQEKPEKFYRLSENYELENVVDRSERNQPVANESARGLATSGFSVASLTPRASVCAILLVGIIFMLPPVVFVNKYSIWSYQDVRFSQIGSVSHSSAKLSFRVPNVKYIDIEWRVLSETSSMPWNRKERIPINEHEDHQAVVQIDGLAANSPYQVRVSSDEHPLFTQRFKTFPNVNERSKFTFSFGSCVYRPYPSLFSAMEGYGAVDSLNPDMFLLIGDQIYIDRPWYMGPHTFGPKFRDAISDANYQKLANRIPSFHMYDDHEIVNDWDAGNSSEPYLSAIRNWYRYSGVLNPEPLEPGGHYYSFQRGDVAFFVMDTRPYRSRETVNRNDTSKTMLGQVQLNHLTSWLTRTNSSSTFKFIVSSVPWSSNTGAKDAWWGYIIERNILLDFIETNQIRGVFLLSGDAHWSAVFQIRPRIYEFCNSPLDAFASTSPGQVTDSPDKKLHFSVGDRYVNRVSVDTVSERPTVTYELFAVSEIRENGYDRPASPIYRLNLELKDL